MTFREWVRSIVRRDAKPSIVIADCTTEIEKLLLPLLGKRLTSAADPTLEALSQAVVACAWANSLTVMLKDEDPAFVEQVKVLAGQVLVQYQLAEVIAHAKAITKAPPVVGGGPRASRGKCNQHDDCDAAEADAASRGVPEKYGVGSVRLNHCTVEDCEDCFGQ